MPEKETGGAVKKCGKGHEKPELSFAEAAHYPRREIKLTIHLKKV